MSINIRKCTLEDLYKLQEISVETFKDTFKDQNSPENMNAYLEMAFNLKQLEKELTTASSQFYFVFLQNELVGYLKVNIKDAQSEEMGEDSLEIERIYIKNHFQKHGVGKHLFNQALEVAKELNKEKIWLGVWEKNEKPSVFIRKWALFKPESTIFTWVMKNKGDIIMTKKL